MDEAAQSAVAGSKSFTVLGPNNALEQERAASNFGEVAGMSTAWIKCLRSTVAMPRVAQRGRWRPMVTRTFMAWAALAALSAMAAGARAAEEIKPSIVLERTKCYGTCASYRMTVHADGSYIWEGRAYVLMKGIRRGRIGQKTFEAALQLLKEARYLEFKDAYLGGKDCSIWATDNPTTIIEFEIASFLQ